MKACFLLYYRLIVSTEGSVKLVVSTDGSVCGNFVISHTWPTWYGSHQTTPALLIDYFMDTGQLSISSPAGGCVCVFGRWGGGLEAGAKLSNKMSTLLLKNNNNNNNSSALMCNIAISPVYLR